VRILASGNLDEEAVGTMVGSGAPIDDFAIGTRLDTSADAPYLDCAYKLQEYAGQARRKRSTGKATWPGRKQVYRRRGPDGRMAGDLLTLEGRPPRGRAPAATGHASRSALGSITLAARDTPARRG
jgi:nicotinate phosphoribosyltransferase